MMRMLVAFGSLLGIHTCADAMMAPLPTLAGDDDCAAVVDVEGGVFQTALYAGQHLDAGTVTVQVEGDHLAVTYDLTGIWYLDEAHLWIGTDLADMPHNRSGNPVFGHFPYKTGDDLLEMPTQHHTFEVALEDLAFACWQEDADFLAVAHAAVFEDGDGDGQRDCLEADDHGHCTEWDEGETAMGEGTDLPDATRWGWSFGFGLTCACAEAYEGCETAFSFDGTAMTDSTCFEEYDVHRWGWTNGPIAYGTYTWDLYAGAAHCDVESATLVGTVDVVYDEGTVTSTFVPAEGWTFDETHTYAGAEPLPTTDDGRYTVAPGRYETLSDEYPLGDIYVIHHAVACPAEEE